MTKEQTEQADGVGETSSPAVDGPDLPAIAGALADAFGGPRGLAQHTKSVYDPARLQLASSLFRWR